MGIRRKVLGQIKSYLGLPKKQLNYHPSAWYPTDGIWVLPPKSFKVQSNDPYCINYNDNIPKIKYFFGWIQNWKFYLFRGRKASTFKFPPQEHDSGRKIVVLNPLLVKSFRKIDLKIFFFIDYFFVHRMLKRSINYRPFFPLTLIGSETCPLLCLSVGRSVGLSFHQA